VVDARDAHLEQARANREFAEYLLRHRPSDPVAVQWAVTAAFYCALHCLQAHLLARGMDPRTHVARDRLLASPASGVPNDVYVAYEALKQRSEAARYRMRRFTAERVRREILSGYLASVTSFVGL
jgi:uncharacterized protein (UPF0332 family)